MDSSFYFQVTDSAQQRTNLLNFLLSSVADTQGIKGDGGNSAYEIALSLGFVGNESEWIASLKGAKGEKGESYSPDSVGASTDKSLYDNQPAGFSFLDIDNSLLYIKRSNATGDWFDGMLFGKGDDGDSAYTIAVANGFIGTEVQWLASLKGTKGDTGDSITDVTSNKVGKNTTVSVYVEGSLAESFVVSDGLDGAGAGDMLKSVYDTNDNGRVDRADIADFVEWSNIANKPIIGNMTKEVYDTTNDGKVDIANLSDATPWTGVTGKPSTYPIDETKSVMKDSDVGSAIIPKGTTAQRTSSPSNGLFRYNSETNLFEGYINGVWGSIGGSSGGNLEVSTINGVDIVTSPILNTTQLRGALNASGTAPIYACRAWVNFNGTGTVAIRASGNVSSITDNGVGDYTVNFTKAMTDVNYAPICTASNSGSSVVAEEGQSSPLKTVTQNRIISLNSSNGASVDIINYSYIAVR